MKRIKDFIYNTSDFIIALLILVIAVGVIVWRMDAILKYPSQVLGNEEPPVIDPIDIPVVTPDNPTNEGGGEDIDEPDVTTDKEVYIDGELAEDITVSVTGSTATAAIQKLIDIGIYDDFEDFKASCKNVNRNYNYVSGGVKNLKAGMTKDDITKVVTYTVDKKKS